MSFERPAAEAPRRPTEDEIRDRVQGMIRAGGENPQLQRNGLDVIQGQLRAVAKELRGEVGADSEGIASFYRGYEAEDIDELVDLIEERLVELNGIIETLNASGPQQPFEEEDDAPPPPHVGT